MGFDFAIVCENRLYPSSCSNTENHDGGTSRVQLEQKMVQFRFPINLGNESGLHVSWMQISEGQTLNVCQPVIRLSIKIAYGVGFAYIQEPAF